MLVRQLPEVWDLMMPDGRGEGGASGSVCAVVRVRRVVRSMVLRCMAAFIGEIWSFGCKTLGRC